MDEPKQITIGAQDLAVVKELIEHSAQRGLIHPKSFTAVGEVYVKIDTILTSIQKNPQ